MVLILLLFATAAPGADCVILLHGLARTKKSMAALENALKAGGYQVVNVQYPSRTRPIEELSETAISNALAECNAMSAEKVHFVTHSLGGIMVRDYLSRHTVTNLGRVVMLAPPNQGSEVVDRLHNNFIFKWLNGPAGQQLGTSTNALPLRLGGVTFPLGVIAGDRSINWINSTMIPGPDDGKVSVSRTKIEGMTDYWVVHTAHPFIMTNRKAIALAVTFLQDGSFEKKQP